MVNLADLPTPLIDPVITHFATINVAGAAGLEQIMEYTSPQAAAAIPYRHGGKPSRVSLYRADAIVPVAADPFWLVPAPISAVWAQDMTARTILSVVGCRLSLMGTLDGIAVYRLRRDDPYDPSKEGYVILDGGEDASVRHISIVLLDSADSPMLGDTPRRPKAAAQQLYDRTYRFHSASRAVIECGEMGLDELAFALDNTIPDEEYICPLTLYVAGDLGVPGAVIPYVSGAFQSKLPSYVAGHDIEYAVVAALGSLRVGVFRPTSPTRDGLALFQSDRYELHAVMIPTHNAAVPSVGPTTALEVPAPQLLPALAAGIPAI